MISRRESKTGLLRPLTTSLIESIKESIPELHDPSCRYCLSEIQTGDLVILFNADNTATFICISCFVTAQYHDEITVEVKI